MSVPVSGSMNLLGISKSRRLGGRCWEMIKSLNPEDSLSPHALNILLTREEGIPLEQKSQWRKRVSLSFSCAAYFIARLSSNVVSDHLLMWVAAAVRNGSMVSMRCPRVMISMINLATKWTNSAG